MAGIDDLFPGLSALTSDSYNAVRKRSAKLNLILQDQEINQLAKGRGRRKPKPLPLLAPKTGKPRHRKKNRQGGDIAVEDEWRRRKPGRTVAGADAGVLPGSRAKKASPRPVGSPAPSALKEGAANSPVGARANAAVKAGIAGGSQAAVVKLASFASGGSRVGALMNYQSHEGEIALEASDGSKVSGVSDIRGLADAWASDAPAREVSKDILMFTVDVAGDRGDEAIRNILSANLAGHQYAWRAERDGAGVHIEVVMTAASRARDEKGKAVRVYDNEKSISAFGGRISTAFGEGASFDDRGFTHGVDGAARYLSRLTRGGQISAELGNGRRLSGHEANLSVAKSWKREMRSREQRDVAHIILSAKPGTDKEAFVAAARATLEREFSGHEFVFALHENRAHLHVHAVVKMQREDGTRMHPRIQDFKRWRATLAEEARQRNVPMEAASRFEQANPPGYKLKDIRRVERGQASEGVRRRVEAVRTRAIHVPTRPEGRERAKAVAGQWQRFAPAEPPVAEGMMRLYRADRPGAALTSAPLFARDRSVAEAMAAAPGSVVSYVDLPKDRAGALKASRTSPDSLVVVPIALAQERKPIVAGGGETLAASPEGSRIIELRQRTRLAADRAIAREGMGQDPTRLPNYSNSSKLSQEPGAASTGPEEQNREQSAMPDLETMQRVRPDLIRNLNDLVDNAPTDRVDEVKRHRQTMIDNWDRGIELQTKVEGSVRIEGDKYVQPQPRQFDNFSAYVQEQRGEAIRYAHKYDDGSAGKVAFTDTGKRVEVNDWKDREATLAAMQLASEKWGELTVKGPERYKNMVIELAAEHGFKIANPELQDRLKAEQARVEAERANRPGFEGPAVPKQTEGDAGKGETTKLFETYPGMPAGRPREGIGETSPAMPAGKQRDEASTVKPDDETYSNAYRAMTAFKSADVDRLVDVLRETRYREGEEGHAYEKREAAVIAIAMANEHAARSLPAEDQARFRQASSAFIETNNGVDGRELHEGLRRGEQQAAERAGGDTKKLYDQVAALRAQVVEDQRSDSHDSGRRNAQSLVVAEGQLWDKLKQSASETAAEGNEPARQHSKQPSHVAGVFLGRGQSPYANEKNAEPTPHVDVQTAKGTVRVWGVGLPDAMSEAGVQKGDTIDLAVVGRERVTKDIRVQDPETKETRIESQLVWRNKWSATIKESAPTQRELQSDSPLAKPVRTDAERNYELERIQRRVDTEAHKETRQANETSALHEKPGDPGYRSQGEAAAARAADKTVEVNRKANIPVTLETSPEIHKLADQQQAVKAEAIQADRNKEQPQLPKHRPRGQRP
ncbi:LPD7 domain-containing protein [Labrys sp. 22185]|uniref:LPD7 domain-containing protein n=1 Tax=Labrys sp. 22185 TaxID=3453888 RepID=UPI003F87B183